MYIPMNEETLYEDCMINRFTADMGNGQSIRFEFYNYGEGGENDEILYTGLIVFDNENEAGAMEDYECWYDYDDPPSTGKDPFTTLKYARMMFKQCIENIREIYNDFDIELRCGWMDNKRQRAYGSVLRPMGFELDSENGYYHKVFRKE